MELIIIAAGIILGALAIALLLRISDNADHRRALDDFHRDLFDPRED
jgi:hypothetical protein